MNNNKFTFKDYLKLFFLIIALFLSAVIFTLFVGAFLSIF